MSDDSIKHVMYYHERTKHHPYRYARGPGYLDWENQPNPFRRFPGSPFVQLPPILHDESPPYHQAFISGAIPASPLTIYSLSRFFELSLAISAWKQYESSRWALRCNPSSGNLHPTEGYLVIPALAEIHSMPGVYHYAPQEHGLERRSEFSEMLWSELMRAFPLGAFLVGLSSIHWREAWKYGERAFRYCQHDVGHALGAMRVAAAVLGWGLTLIEEMDDFSISQLFGLDREEDFKDSEREHPDLVCVVFPPPLNMENKVKLDTVAKIAAGEWTGHANRLSEEEVPWDVINLVSDATVKPRTDAVAVQSEKFFDLLQETTMSQVTARKIIRQRRSAQDFDGVKHISDKEFYKILFCTTKSSGIPWDSISWSPHVHLCLYVHKVKGIMPGLYFLVRDPEKLGFLKSAMNPQFSWQKPEGCPEHLDLYLLQEGNFQRQATQVSCTQEIAGQGVFSLGMISEFADSLEKYGAWFYRRLFWESGLIGQMLYLAAEEAGIRGTGIGCYFDDSVHIMQGISGNKLQSLYHFTIGGPVTDLRLTTLPAYPWSE